jgi:putative tryptophan/tyrosine transport system substrate-binding protein
LASGCAGAAAGRSPTIGYLGATAATAEKPRPGAFMQRLYELNWIVGRTLAVEYRWAESRKERLADLAAELVRLRPDAVVPTSTAAALACKQATTVVPIVFPLSGDPLETGLVTSLARPGGNITGLSNRAADLGGTRVEVLRDNRNCSHAAGLLLEYVNIGMLSRGRTGF